jgi:hypothetical protein
MTRAPRMSNIPAENEIDETTDVEIQMAASGRKSVVPPEGLVGAHTERRETEGSEENEEASRIDEPFGGGADVAPTKTAEVRERARHALQREQGVVPAGTEGNPRQRRPDDADREALDAAADMADGVVDKSRRQ